MNKRNLSGSMISVKVTSPLFPLFSNGICINEVPNLMLPVSECSSML